MRRLPIFILLDTSGSMRGEPIEAVRSGLRSLLSSLHRDPYALETVHIEIITFDREARILAPLTDIESFQMPEIPEPVSSPTMTGEALQLLCARYDQHIIKNAPDRKGDWLPLAVLLTDGAPSDIATFDEMAEKIKNYHFAHLLVCAAGPSAKVDPLRRFASEVVSLETMDSNSFAKFWQWVSMAVSRHSQAADAVSGALPPPPKEIKFAI